MSAWSAACAQNAALVRISPTVVTWRIVRRSITSASAPPQSPKTTSGTSPNTPGQADVRRGAGDRVDLRRDGDHGQLGADHGDDVGRPEPAEGRGGQRSRVREQSPEMHVRTLRPATAGHGGAVGADARLVREPEAPRAVGGEPEPDPRAGADVSGRSLGRRQRERRSRSGRGRSASAPIPRAWHRLAGPRARSRSLLAGVRRERARSRPSTTSPARSSTALGEPSGPHTTLQQ